MIQCITLLPQYFNIQHSTPVLLECPPIVEQFFPHLSFSMTLAFILIHLLLFLNTFAKLYRSLILSREKKQTRSRQAPRKRHARQCVATMLHADLPQRCYAPIPRNCERALSRIVMFASWFRAVCWPQGQATQQLRGSKHASSWRFFLAAKRRKGPRTYWELMHTNPRLVYTKRLRLSEEVWACQKFFNDVNTTIQQSKQF